MMDRIINTFAAIGIVWGAWAGVSYLVPASVYMTVESVYAYDTPYGKQPELAVVRHIKQDFRGSYSVVVRRVDTLAIACDGSGGPITYRAEAALPEIVTLDWWLGEPCALEPGRYTIHTEWAIDRWLLADARISYDTPEFEVQGKVP